MWFSLRYACVTFGSFSSNTGLNSDPQPKATRHGRTSIHALTAFIAYHHIKSTLHGIQQHIREDASKDTGMKRGFDRKTRRGHARSFHIHPNPQQRERIKSSEDTTTEKSFTCKPYHDHIHPCQVNSRPTTYILHIHSLTILRQVSA